MAASTRISFIDAINEPRLLQPLFEPDPQTGERFLSLPQAVWLKVIYGCPLSSTIKDERGWSELDYYAASQGRATYDELGYLRSVQPTLYEPQEYREAWGVCGVRSGKTDRLAATVVAYEAVCGGHESRVRKGRPAVCFQIAQDLRLAKYSLHSIQATLRLMKFLRTDSPNGWIRTVTADRIDLKNGVVIAVTPPTVKSIRGYDSPVAVLDEVGVWYQDADSANPDFEIYNNVSSRQAQFEHPKIVGISSPWNRGGLLFDRFEAGSRGSRLHCPDCRTARFVPDCPTCVKMRLPHAARVVLHSTTAASNPIIPRSWLEDARNKDPKAFERECLARFQDSLSGFLSSSLIEKARAVGVLSRPANPKFFYVAAIDPAFRRDAFGFTIVHADPQKGIIQDHVTRWKAEFGIPLNPADIFGQIAPILKEYRVTSVYSDQHSIEALHYIAQQFGFALEEVHFSATSKAEIYANLQQVLNQGRLHLLDHDETINELKSIEKRNTQGGGVQIGAPDGKYDDMATVIALAVHEAVWMLPKKDPTAPAAKSIISRHIESLAARKASWKVQEDVGGWDDDW